MVALFAIFFSSFVVAFSGAMMPGPLLTATISESTRRGFRAGPLMIVGHATLELAFVIALLLGLSPFLKQDKVFVVVALTGGAILLWMAAGMFRSLPTLRLSWEAGASTRRYLPLCGLLLSIANPYWFVWWATIGVVFILKSSQQGLGLVGVIAFYVGHILADFVWYSMVSLAVAKGRRFLSDRLYRGIIGGCAVFMLGFAVYFIGSAIKTVLSGHLF